MDAGKRLTRRENSQTVRWGLMLNGVEDNLMWLVSGFAMSNGGRYFDESRGGEAYCNEPNMLGDVQFLDDLAHKHQVMPPGITDANAMAATFLSGRAAMILNSTGALGFVRDNMKQPWRVTCVPYNILPAVAIGGGSLMTPAGNSPERQHAAWELIQWLSSPETAGSWSRFTGYFAPRRAAYDLPEMQAHLRGHPDAQVALDQLAHARPWFATFQTVPVRKAPGSARPTRCSGPAPSRRR